MNEITSKVLNAVEIRDYKELKTILDSFPSDWSSFDTDDYLLLHHLCESGWSEGLNLALTYKGAVANLNLFDELSWTPLIHAVKANDLSSARALLGYGADVNAHEEARIGNTALIEAVDLGNEAMVNLLLMHGADPMISGWMCRNALEKAQRQYKKTGNTIAGRILEVIRNKVTRSAANSDN